MKKLMAICAMVAMSCSLWAAGTVSIRWDATAHAGLITGDHLDTSGMSAGTLLYAEILFENFDFTLAGYEFQINYPPALTLLSESDADWDAGTGAVYTPGAFVTGAIQQLPAASDGSLVANVNVTLVNGSGRVRIGNLWTVVGDRPAPGVGGVIGRICFELNNVGCDSDLETVSVESSDWIFADDTAAAATVSAGDIDLTFGNGSALRRADGNHDATRNSFDAILNIRGAFFGATDAALQGLPGGWNWQDNLPEFAQVFDGNCDGAVNSFDAIINLRLAFGIFARTEFKNLEFFGVEKSGEFVVNSEGNVGAMANIVFKTNNLELGKPVIDESDIKAGWMIETKTNGVYVAYILANPHLKNAQIPFVRIPFTVKGEDAGIAFADTKHQNLELKPFTYTPMVEIFERTAQK